MMGFRSATLTGLLAVSAVLAGCGGVDEPSFASDVERELSRAREYGSALLTSARTEPSVEEAIAVGYLERHRLGLGSPFRLIEQLLQDPRLERPVRERLAWTLLARTLDGRGYRVDSSVLGSDAAETERHLELIEGAIGGSPDPAGGELAVRLAYAMAGAEGVVPRRQSRAGAHVAAMVRDRTVAREDTRRLLRAAGGDVDPLSLLTVWRVERRFRVEAPAMLTLSSDAERDAMERAPKLLRSIRDIDDRPRGGPLVPTLPAVERPLLSPTAAAVLAELTTANPSPPQTPVAVAVDIYRRATVKPEAQTDRDRFFENATNEERLAAEYALLSHSGALDRSVRLAALGAGVALRTYAQERPWFAGFDGPARRELEDRFGLAAVEFPDDMPAEWRPYYRRMLQSALSDLQRVLPSLQLRGLRVRFEARPGSSGTLAVHDPRTRTVHIPAATGAGTIAHEIAHDLDWQTAVQRYRVRGDYATDRAVRTDDERLARVLRGLTTASLRTPPTRGVVGGHATRPAEVFARSVDWFAAVALAREGRVNGYLSSVQDDLLTGYGTVTPPDVTGKAGQSLIALLDEVAPVYPSTRSWFLESYGQGRIQTPYDLARRILEADLSTNGGEVAVRPAERGGGADMEPTDPEHDVDALDGESIASPDQPAADRPELAWIADAIARMDRLEETRSEVIGGVDASCQAVGYDNRLDAARRRLVQDAAEARARGIAAATAERLVGPSGRRWIEARLDGRGSRELDPVVMEALEPLAVRVESMTAAGRGHGTGIGIGRRGDAGPAPSPVAGTAGCPRLMFLDAVTAAPALNR